MIVSLAKGERLLATHPSNLVEELVRIYYEEETWHQTRLSKEEAFKYHEYVLSKGRIIPVVQRGQLLAYVESWRVNFTNLGRILCHAPFFPLEEDIETGNICYGANIWIKRECRGTAIDSIVRNYFFQQNYMCDYFVWESSRKKAQVLKVFKKQEFYDKYFTQEGTGDLNGQG